MVLDKIRLSTTGFIENSISVSFPHIKSSTPDKQKLMAL